MTSVNSANGRVKKRHVKKFAGIGLAAVLFAPSLSVAIAQERRASDKPSPYETAVRQPSTDEIREDFKNSMLNITPPGVSAAQPEGCFKAEYPDKKWIKVECGKAPEYPYGGGVGKGVDFFTLPVGTITSATGSFSAVFGGLSENGQVPAIPGNPGTPSNQANAFSLQLNTNKFSPTSICGGSTSCQVWQQFIFSNLNSCGPSACVYIEYWIYNPPGQAAGTCPGSFKFAPSPASGVLAGCFLNTRPSLMPRQTSTVLGQLQLTGQIIGGGVDQVSIAPPPEPGKPFTVYTITFADAVALAGAWNGAEYNLFGDCCNLGAFFTSKTTIDVRLQTTSASATAPTCSSSFNGTTAETNNLSLVPPSSPVCTASGGTPPQIAFQESNACVTPQCLEPVTISFHQVGACNGFATSSGEVNAGGNAAYVVFGIDSIDNSLGTAAFSFDPTNLFVQQGNLVAFFDPGSAFYPNILGPLAGAAATVGPGVKSSFSVPGYGALVVTTSNPNGAAGASKTAFSLNYNQQPNDPPVNLVNSTPGVTTWPLTENCASINLH